MSLFYNPKTKKAQPWVLIFFIMIPFLVVLIGYFLGHNAAQQKKAVTPSTDKDIFAK